LKDKKIEFIRTEHVSEKKSGEGVQSVKVNPLDYLWSASVSYNGKLLLCLRRGGDAYEILMLYKGWDRKVAESTDVEVVDILLKSSWENQ
jgi:hypothetical protein